jgi:hypothetical protein
MAQVKLATLGSMALQQILAVWLITAPHCEQDTPAKRHHTVTQRYGTIAMFAISAIFADQHCMFGYDNMCMHTAAVHGHWLSALHKVV